MEINEYRIRRQIEQMDKLRDNPFLYRVIALKTIVNLFSIKGYCSVLWMNRWFSEMDSRQKKGGVYSFYHTGNPPYLLREAWEFHIESGNSIIEKAIWERYKDKKIGFVTAQEVIEKRTMITDMVGWLAKVARLGEMGYLWIRPNDQDFWVFCLRKKRYEPAFSSKERTHLLQIGENLLFFRRDWHKEFSKGVSEKQLIVFDLKCQGLTDIEISKKMKITEHMVGNEVAAIYKFWKKEKKQIGAVAQVDNPAIEDSTDLLIPKDLPDKLKNILSHQDWRILWTLAQNPFKIQKEIAQSLEITHQNLRTQIGRMNKKLKTNNQQEKSNYMKCLIKVLEILNDDIDFQ